MAQDKNGQSRDTENVGHKTRMDNLETLTMLGTRHRTRKNKTKNKTQKTRKISNMDPNKKLYPFLYKIKHTYISFLHLMMLNYNIIIEEYVLEIKSLYYYDLSLKIHIH